MKLIMRADDLGISKAVNYGIYEAIRNGVISCAGLMPNMDTAQHGYDLLKELDVCLGQHTNISLGYPVSDPLLIPSLVNQQGRFYTSHEINHRKEDTIDIKECELEIEAQLQRFIEITGKYPDYFEGHAVFSSHYFQALENVAKRHHLFFVNPMDEEWVKIHNIQCLPFAKRDDNGLYSPYEYLKEHLEDIKNNTCTVIVFHPGYIDQYLLEHSSYTLIRPMECEFLCSQWLKKIINKNHIEVVSFKIY